MFGWEDISYSNGAISKEGLERALVVWPGQSSLPRDDLSPRVHYSESGCLLVVAHLTESLLWGTVHV